MVIVLGVTCKRVCGGTAVYVYGSGVGITSFSKPVSAHLLFLDISLIKTRLRQYLENIKGTTKVLFA